MRRIGLRRLLLPSLLPALLPILLLAAALPAAAQPLPAWLAGCWEGEGRSAGISEAWTAPRGGLMLGIGHTVRGARSEFEFLRIVERDGVAVYVAQPGGRPPTEFRATLNEPGRIVFANPAHDAPKTLDYRRDGERLQVLLDVRPDQPQGKPGFGFRRVACDAQFSPR